MSWIDDEAKKNMDDESEEADKKEVRSRSGYWAALVKQVDRDVQRINEHGHWKKKLGDYPLQFGPPSISDGNTYQISKSGKSGVLVAFQHQGRHIQVTRRFTENPLSRSREFPAKETLAVDVMGNTVVLTNRDGATFVVPEDASQYLLKAVIESLKDTPS